MIEVDLLIFDFDGTLVNSLGDIEQSVNHTLNRLGLAPLPGDRIRLLVGDGIRTLLRRSLETQETLTEARLDIAQAMYMEHHGDHCLDTTQPYPGVREVLSHYTGKKKVVVSNKSEKLTRKIADALDLSARLDWILGGDSLTVKKPDPAVIVHVLGVLGVEASRSVIIGDGPQDMAAGTGAGIHTCGVTYGYRDRRELGGAEIVVDDIRELKDFFV